MHQNIVQELKVIKLESLQLVPVVRIKTFALQVRFRQDLQNFLQFHNITI